VSLGLIDKVEVMGLLVNAITALIVMIALVVGLLIATSNSQLVDVDLILVNFSSSLGMIVTGAFCLGALLGLSFVVLGMLSGRVKLVLKNRELQAVRKELDNLRALGVKGSHG